MKLRLATLPLWLFFAAACHTMDAGRRLVAASPAYRVEVSATNPLELKWKATFGESSYPDAIVVGLFVRSVDYGGTWELLEPVRACVLVEDHIQEVGSDPVTLDEAGPWSMPDHMDAERSAASGLGYTHWLAPRRGSGRLEISGVELLPILGGSVHRLDLPRERPMLDARRWGWLVAGPVLDAATIIAVPPIVLFYVISHAIGYDC